MQNASRNRFILLLYSFREAASRSLQIVLLNFMTVSDSCLVRTLSVPIGNVRLCGVRFAVIVIVA